MSFAKRLEEISKDIQIADIARISGISNTLLSRYKKGKSVPGLEAFIAIVRATGVNCWWLATGEGEKYPDQKPESKDLMNWIDEFGEEFPKLEINIKTKEKNQDETKNDKGDASKVA